MRLTLSAGHVASAADALARLPGIAAVEPVDDVDGSGLMVFPHGGKSIVGAVGDLLRNHRWEPLALRVERGRLDDVFRQVTIPVGAAH